MHARVQSTGACGLHLPSSPGRLGGRGAVCPGPSGKRRLLLPLKRPKEAAKRPGSPQ